MCWHFKWLSLIFCPYVEATASAKAALVVAGVSLAFVAAVGVWMGMRSRRGVGAEVVAMASGAQFGLGVLATAAIAYAGAYPLALLGAAVVGIAGYTRFALVPRMASAPGAVRTAGLLAWVGGGLAAVTALIGA